MPRYPTVIYPGPLSPIGEGAELEGAFVEFSAFLEGKASSSVVDGCRGFVVESDELAVFDKGLLASNSPFICCEIGNAE